MPNSATTTDAALAAAESPAPRIVLDRRVDLSDPKLLIDFLHTHSGLSKQQLKDAASKGAVLLRRGGSARRIRRAKAELRAGDRIELHYDRELLALRAPTARCIADRGRYSLWYKPAGLLAQGNEFGDHCALTRQVEQAWQPPRPVWLIHRLDREAAGLMLLAHDREVAADLSRQFQSHSVEKRYRVQVRGDIGSVLGPEGRLDQPLDGKPAGTDYQVLHWDPAARCSTLAVRIHTGRLHQIRRHLADAGFPVLGDPRYGVGNKDASGLRLVADALAFDCPLLHLRVEFRLAPEEVGF